MLRRFQFKPIAIETSGVYGPTTRVIIKEIGKRISEKTGDARVSVVQTKTEYSSSERQFHINPFTRLAQNQRPLNPVVYICSIGTRACLHECPITRARTRADVRVVEFVRTYGGHDTYATYRYPSTLFNKIIIYLSISLVFNKSDSSESLGCAHCKPYLPCK